jgi:glycosyltransferase involved in cell wall biosynthesis
VTGLRVDLVSEHASPLATLGGADAGGQNVHVAALAAELAAQGCEVTVLTRADAPDLPRRATLASGVAVEHVAAGPLRAVPKDELFEHMPAFAEHLHRRWRTARPSVVHAHFWMSGWAADRAAVGLADPPPLVQTFHALGLVKRRHQGTADTSPAVREGVEAALVSRADHIIATCTDELAELAALGAEPARVSVIPCGVDTRLFRPQGPSAPRPEHGPHRLVVVSRLVPRKGIGEVIEALPLLPGTELVVAGGPPAAGLDTDPEAVRLRELSRARGVEDRVRLLGSVTRAEVPALLRSADVAVCVPWYEPFGIVPLEAMACGIPVVGSAVGGLLDTVAHRRTGLLVPPRDPEALAAAIRHLLDNPSLRLHLGAEAAAQVREHYTWPQVAWATLRVYERLVVGGAREAVPA